MTKFKLTLIFGLLSATTALAQAPDHGLQITEVMYNPPEYGIDSLEFIELFNGNNSSLDISGYKVHISNSGNPRLVFPSGTLLAPNEIIVLAYNDSTFIDAYGVNPDYKLSGAGLANGGSLINILNSNDEIVTGVTYASNWYQTTNGGGASLNRCNYTSNINSADTWAASNNPVSTNITINGYALLASPGELEVCPITPVYSIASIHTENSNGVADSIGVFCELRGIVHSDNFRGSTGVEFALIDDTNNGLFVFSATNINGFTVNRGDSIHVRGTVVQNNGLIQFQPSAIDVISSNNNYVTPILVTSLNESYEGKLIKTEALTVDQTTNSSTFGFNILASSGSGYQFSIRVDADVDAYTRTFVAGEVFSVTGIGTQLDDSSPYTEEYQLQVRDLADFDFTLATNNVLASNLKIYPNPTSGQVKISNLPEVSTIKVIDLTGRVVIEKSTNSSTDELNLSTFKAGIYMIQIESNNQIMQQKVVVK